MTSLTQIAQIAIPISDVERAVEFYRDTLGLKFLFKAPPGLAFFDCGGVRLMLDSSDASRAGQASILYYKVDDLPTTHAALTEKGVAFEADPHLVAKMSDHDLWMAFLRDPDGNLLALMAEVRS